MTAPTPPQAELKQRVSDAALAEMIAAPRPQQPAATNDRVVPYSMLLDLRDSRAESARLREAVVKLWEELDMALSNLMDEDDGGHDVCKACCEYANQHAPNCDVPGMEAALRDTAALAGKE